MVRVVNCEPNETGADRALFKVDVEPTRIGKLHNSILGSLLLASSIELVNGVKEGALVDATRIGKLHNSSRACAVDGGFRKNAYIYPVRKSRACNLVAVHAPLSRH